MNLSRLVEDGGTPEYWYVLNLNPEPWAIGPVSAIRKGGKIVPFVGRNVQLHTYKEAVRAELRAQNPIKVDGKVRLTFLFWRHMAEYQSRQARTARKHEADLSNLVKSTEDAIQDLLIGNDKNTVEAGAYMIEQGPNVEGRIIIVVQKAPETPDVLSFLPAHVLALMEKHPELLGDNDDYGAGSAPEGFF